MATAPFEFNIAKGKSNRYADLPAANDALILVLLSTPWPGLPYARPLVRIP